MNVTQRVSQEKKMAVDVKELMNILCVGRQTAEKIGQDANARFKVGRRTLYNVEKVQAYIDTLSD